jgi:hypothetical protein
MQSWFFDRVDAGHLIFLSSLRVHPTQHRAAGQTFFDGCPKERRCARQSIGAL